MRAVRTIAPRWEAVELQLGLPRRLQPVRARPLEERPLEAKPLVVGARHRPRAQRSRRSRREAQEQQ